MRREMRDPDNYFEEIEADRGGCARAVGHAAPGALSERDLTDLAAHFGFPIARVQDLPPSTRSITDTAPPDHLRPATQRREHPDRPVRRRADARPFALGHGEPAGFEEYVRQRVEANYFAGALLAPERSVTDSCRTPRRQDISVEDLKEVFYISYEMAAHRLTNLITRHLDIPVHFQRSDPEGFVWKAYENDGRPAGGHRRDHRGATGLPAGGAPAGPSSQRTPTRCTTSTRRPRSATFWSATHIEIGAERNDAVTVGTDRGARPLVPWIGHPPAHGLPLSRPLVLPAPADDVVRRWDGAAWPSAKDHSAFVSGLPTDAVSFSPYPGVDLTDVYSFLNRHAPEP